MNSFTVSSPLTLVNGVLSLNNTTLATLLNLSGKMDVFGFDPLFGFNGNGELTLSGTNLTSLLNLGGKMDAFTLGTELLFR